MTLSLAATAALGAQTIVPAATPIDFRVLDKLSSDSTIVGHQVRAIVIAPVRVDGVLAIAPGTAAWGHVVRAGRDAAARRYQLEVAFDSLQADGGIVPLSVRVTSVDNAREIVDSTGRIVGKPTSHALKSKRTWAFIALGVVHPFAAVALLGASTIERRSLEQRIRYRPGTDISATLTKELVLHRPPPRETWDRVLAADSLDPLVAKWPVQVYAEGGLVPADLLNVALIGDSVSVVNAFHAAGWDIAARMSVRASLATFIRASANRGYAHQPVSALLLEGRAPDLVFERVTNTFSKRHHVRLWKWISPVDGAPLWVASASHDVGIQYLKGRGHFTHRVDPVLDDERDKVADDLWAADCIAKRSDVARTLPSDLRVNDQRDHVTTDGRVIVLRLRTTCATTAAR